MHTISDHGPYSMFKIHSWPSPMFQWLSHLLSTPNIPRKSPNPTSWWYSSKVVSKSQNCMETNGRTLFHTAAWCMSVRTLWFDLRSTVFHGSFKSVPPDGVITRQDARQTRITSGVTPDGKNMSGTDRWTMANTDVVLSVPPLNQPQSTGSIGTGPSNTFLKRSRQPLAQRCH